MSEFVVPLSLKVSKNGGRSYERQFFLFSDILMYAKQRLLDSGAHHSYICCCILPLNHCTASRVFGGHAATQGTEGSLFTVSSWYILGVSRKWKLDPDYSNMLKVAFSSGLFINDKAWRWHQRVWSRRSTAI